MEYFDIVDESGLPTGEIVSRDIAHRDGIRHRTAHVWVVRPAHAGYDILLQKRSRNKDSFPGFFDTSSAGHIPAGSEPLPSALRELKEELGISALPDQLHYAVFVYSEPVETETLTLQESEVEEVRWFHLDAVWEEIQHSRERICVPSQGLLVLKKYLSSVL